MWVNAAEHLGRKRLLRLSSSAWTFTVRVCGSTVSAMRETVPFRRFRPDGRWRMGPRRARQPARSGWLSGTCDVTQTVLRSATVTTGTVCISAILARHDGQFEHLPESGDVTTTSCWKSPGVRPSTFTRRVARSRIARAWSAAAFLNEGALRREHVPERQRYAQTDRSRSSSVCAPWSAPTRPASAQACADTYACVAGVSVRFLCGEQWLPGPHRLPRVPSTLPMRPVHRGITSFDRCIGWLRSFPPR